MKNPPRASRVKEGGKKSNSADALAESAGFEPAKRVTACLVSNEVVSTTHPTLL